MKFTMNSLGTHIPEKGLSQFWEKTVNNLKSASLSRTFGGKNGGKNG